MGVHCAQVMAMATPKLALTVMMINQTSALTHPDEMRKTVTANDVLLHSAARMEKEPATLEKRRNTPRLLGSNCVRGRPRPRLTQAEMKAQSATRASCWQRCVRPWIDWDRRQLERTHP
jgi:hypothetical protein